MEIYIVRHGETVWNKERRLQGHTDVPLSEYGKELAEKTGKALKNVNIDRIYSSPLDRAYQTALLIRGSREIEIRKDERILELNFGGYEGQTIRELEKNDASTFRYFFSRPELYQPDETGESLEQICSRAEDFMKHEIEPMQKIWERVMIVAHGAMNKALMSYIKGNEIKDFWSGGLQKNCNVIMVDLKQGQYHIINEVNTFY